MILHDTIISGGIGGGGEEKEEDHQSTVLCKRVGATVG